ncbi:MAG: hypothetical protein PVH84_11790 [Candidatus Aminicenantes bacterium]|jgi:hypothetical protein
MKNRYKYVLIATVLLSISLGLTSCNQDDISGIEFTDFSVEVIYERVGEYISDEDNDSTVGFSIDDAEGRIYWNGVRVSGMEQLSETRFKIVIDTPLPKTYALYIGVLDPGKLSILPEGATVGERIYINGMEITRIGDHPFNITGTVGYFLVREDGGIAP